MTSPYLEKPVRTERQAARDLESHRDHQPDIRFNHDALENGLHREIAGASFIRQQTKTVLGIMRCDQMLFMPDDRREADNANWIYDARKAHTKAIANREAYKAAINERDIQRSLGLVPTETAAKEWLEGEEDA